MTLAPHRTQASAARKRGGGLARRYLLASLLMGRHLRQAGGETKSLFRAAAGITSALPSACGSLVYPTKGVRQAQESSLSLRSTSLPAAQLVKGGKQLSISTNERLQLKLGISQIDIKRPNRATQALVDTDIQGSVLGLMQLMNQRREIDPKLGGDLMPPNTQIIIQIQLRTIHYPLKSGNSHSSNLKFWILTELISHLLQHLPHLSDHLVKPLGMSMLTLDGLLRTKTDQVSAPFIRQVHCHQDTQHRANGLHPSGPIDTLKAPQKLEDQSHGWRNQNKNQHNQGAHLPRVITPFLGNHLYILTSLKAHRLPAAAPLVHEDAA